MRIDFVEIANFRKLRSTRVAFSKDNTVFVGANNSGKTSAMVALRYFLVERERSSFSLNDITLSHWPIINLMGETWEQAKAADQSLPAPDCDEGLPVPHVWLHVEDNEVHYVQKILPTLDWEGGRLGVRLRFEPKDALELQNEYLAARTNTEKMRAAGKAMADENKAESGKIEEFTISLWPQNLIEFLRRSMGRLFGVKAYVLDYDKCKSPAYGLAQPQLLPEVAEPIDGNPFKGLIRIDLISAQRGFGQEESANYADDDDSGGTAAFGTRKLSEQLRQYYNRHLDPLKNQTVQDLQALQAIEDAQKAFDDRLKDGFAAALKEMEKLGYPGVTDPSLKISTRLKPVDGLNHETAVQYLIQMTDGESAIDLHLPEDSNGLGYQNLISMVFRLMSFRDAWMRVGKAQSTATASAGNFIPPLHLVLIEEPEAHLHTQVQQVFIRQAYKILRTHDELKDGRLSTQLVVSTHSSHIAHECEFASLRYFRRMPANAGDIPTSCVINLTDVFGNDPDTKRFVTRYLKVTHCDLFFADGAVLIEGPAERILVPHFIRYHKEFSDLLECYITWLEIGGSHAHRMKELIERLGLTTLIITDLDAEDMDGKATPPERGSKQKSRNETLKSWCPATEILDELIDKSENDMIKTYQNERFSIRVAYQRPLTITFKGVEGEALANTLEDALVFQNIDFFATHKGKGLLTKFRKAIKDSMTIPELSKTLFDDLKGGGKAELALDLLDIEPPNDLKPPVYIREGLLWLASQLRQHQKELGLAVSIINTDGESREAE